MKDLVHTLYTLLAPWLALSLLLTGRNPRPSIRRILLSASLGLLILLIPLGKFPICRWIAMLEPNPSITLTALLAIALIARGGGRRFFRPQDWRAAWIAGSIAALILFPMGLGLTSLDPYAWGWGPGLPVATTALAVMFLLGGNRFGIVLLLCLIGMLFPPMESQNSWDAVIDPFYAFFSLIITALLVFRTPLNFVAPASPSGRGDG
ncbi:MAG: hypothetical protein WCP60_06975 [bacterium]